MLRPKIKFILNLLAVLSIVTGKTTFEDKVTWDDFHNDRTDYYPASSLIWPRLDNSPFLVHNANDGNRRLLIIKRSVDSDESSESELTHHDAESKIENISNSMNVRKPRMNSEEMRSKQAYMQLRPRMTLDQIENYNNNNKRDDEPANYPQTHKSRSSSKSDLRNENRYQEPFVSRVMLYPNGRDNREKFVPRQYDIDEENESPIFINPVREHDFDVQIPQQPPSNIYPMRRGFQQNYYPDERSRMYPYELNRYINEHVDVDKKDYYDRLRVARKPNRILYYATLPDIPRKPQRINNYPKPYDMYIQNQEAQETDRNRVTSIMNQSMRRQPQYPYNNFNNYLKRSSYYDRRKPSYAAGGDYDINRENYKDKMRSDERTVESQLAQSRDNFRLPWPVHIGTELSVKNNERIPGRKIFSQIEDNEENEGPRVKKNPGSIERKQDISENDHSSNKNDNNDNN